MKKLLLLVLTGITLTSSLTAMETNLNKRLHEQEQEEQGPNKHQKTDGSSSTDNNNTPQENPAAIIVTKDDQKTELTSQELEIIKLSETIKNMLDDCMEIGQQENCPELYFPNLTKENFMLIATLLSHLYYQRVDELAKHLDQLSIFELFHLLGLINYLDVSSLFEHCIEICASKLTNSLKFFITNPTDFEKLSELPAEISNALACRILKNYPDIKDSLLSDAISETPFITLENHSEWIYKVVFSKDGRLLITGADDEKVHIYDISDLKNITLVSTISDIQEVHSLTLSSDSKILVIASNYNTSGLYDITDPKNPTLIKKLTDQTEYVHRVAISANDQLLVLASDDEKIFIYNISDHENITFLQELDNDSPTNDMIFTADNKYFITGSEAGMICIYTISDTNFITLLKKFSAYPDAQDNQYAIYSLALNYDNALLAVCLAEKNNQPIIDSIIFIYDISDLDKITLFQNLPNETSFGSLAFSTNNQLLATGSLSGSISLYNIKETKKISHFKKIIFDQGIVLSTIAFSPNSQVFAGSYNNKVCLYNLKTFYHIKKLIPKDLLVEQALLLAAILFDEQPSKYPPLVTTFERLDPVLQDILKKDDNQ